MQNPKRLVVCSLFAMLASAPLMSFADVVWTTSQGTTRISFDQDALNRLGLRVTQVDDASSTLVNQEAVLQLDARQPVEVSTDGGVIRALNSNRMRHIESFNVSDGSTDILVRELSLQLPSDISVDELGEAARLSGSDLELQPLKVGFDVRGERLLAEGMDVVIGASLAQKLGDPSLRGETIGEFTLTIDLAWHGGDTPDPQPEPDDTARGGNGGTTCDLPGVDVMVGDLIDISNYNSIGGIEAFAVGTTSCNVGSENLLWVSSTNQHPVIAQNMYRHKDGRFEQIGQSWLKHGFTALTQNICGCGCSGQGGSVLGVGCSDPYCCGLNGSQPRLGPRSEVNAHTGVYPYPFTHGNQGSSGNSIYKRLQVAISDLDTNQDGGGDYFVEGHYVASDDAADGNQDNNASYRPITISGSGSNWSASLAGTTQRELPGIRAWQDSDPSVVETDIRIPGEGLVIMAAKTTDLGGGMWHYEYAVQNLNSDRSIGSFSIPVGANTTVTNIGFHDVDYHSGDPYDLTDWPGSQVGANVVWETDDFGTNPNANAIRWSTMYNFRFDADRPPTTANVTLGIFKPGTPSSVTAATVGPDGVTDCNDNGIDDPSDIANGASLDCDGSLVPDECESFPDVAITSIPVATGLSSPVAVAAPVGDADRLFIVEQNSGQIKILKSGSVLGTPFLNIGGLVLGGSERGLLSMAFHPDYDSNGFFYVNYTNLSGDTVIARYTVSGDPDIANPASALILLTVDQLASNHNGGQIQFGPDDMLYIGMGDGGGGDDPLNRAQDINFLLGKMLRLDVDAAAPYIPAGNKFSDEIYSVGFRNPWRFSFDRTTGDMYVGDVGQDAREEITFESAATVSGKNYGWDCREGFIPTPTNSGGYGCDPDSPFLVDPIIDVRHSGDPIHPGFICSIIGGYVYRGCDIPSLHGTYFYADFCGGWVFSIKYDGSTVTEQTNRTSELGPLSSIVSFGEDGLGEMYIVAGSSVHKIVPVPPVCGDGNLDANEQCDDGNTTPGDGCDENCDIEPCPTALGDGDSDCDRDLSDFDHMQHCYTGDVGTGQQVFATGCVCFDTDGDGDVDLTDFNDLGSMTGPDASVGGCLIP